jgi:hypothetical protein
MNLLILLNKMSIVEVSLIFDKFNREGRNGILKSGVEKEK